jgi:hypothetical protein
MSSTAARKKETASQLFLRRRAPAREHADAIATRVVQVEYLDRVMRYMRGTREPGTIAVQRRVQWRVDRKRFDVITTRRILRRVGGYWTITCQDGSPLGRVHELTLKAEANGRSLGMIADTVAESIAKIVWPARGGE